MQENCFKKTAKIMIVDDTPANVTLLEELLLSEGYEKIKSITDSRQAVEIYEIFRPDVLLLDLNMPHMSGFEVMEEIRKVESLSYAPILVVTAQSDSKTKQKALAAGAKDFLTKPFDLSETLQRIHNMIEIHLLHRKALEQNSFLERAVFERTRLLEEARTEVVERLARAAEYRDNETGNHVNRMSRFSAIIAGAAGLKEDRCQLIQIASPMHDIGKIGVPDSILLKPGKLDAQEWEVMKTHTTIGGKILSGGKSELMQIAKIIALTHHEKWDGSGYPLGLKGNDIPLEGQIVAIADVFDALTSERPYKKPWPLEDTLALIREQKGKHFSPLVVDCLNDRLETILEIQKQFADAPGQVSHLSSLMASAQNETSGA